MRSRLPLVLVAIVASAIVVLVVTRLALGTVLPSYRDDPEERAAIAGGDPERGERAILRYGCPSCHTIPGVPGANATVGPPLTDLAHRGVLAGRLPNTADNLIRWIRHPQQIEPGNVMPEMGVTERDARDIAAYLYSADY